MVLLKEVILVIESLCRRQFISERLQELRKEKFGNAVEGGLLSEGDLIGPSDASEAPDEMQHFQFSVREMNLISSHSMERREDTNCHLSSCPPLFWYEGVLCYSQTPASLLV